MTKKPKPKPAKASTSCTIVTMKRPSRWTFKTYVKPKPVKLTKEEVAALTWYAMVPNIRDRDKVLDRLFALGLTAEPKAKEFFHPIATPAGCAALRAAKGKK